MASVTNMRYANPTPLSLPEVTTKIVMGVVITKKQNLHLVLIIIVDEYIMIMLSLRGPWENALIVPSLSTSPRLHWPLYQRFAG